MSGVLSPQTRININNVLTGTSIVLDSSINSTDIESVSVKSMAFKQVGDFVIKLNNDGEKFTSGVNVPTVNSTVVINFNNDPQVTMGGYIEEVQPEYDSSGGHFVNLRGRDFGAPLLERHVSPSTGGKAYVNARYSDMVIDLLTGSIPGFPFQVTLTPGSDNVISYEKFRSIKVFDAIRQAASRSSGSVNGVTVRFDFWVDPDGVLIYVPFGTLNPRTDGLGANPAPVIYGQNLIKFKRAIDVYPLMNNIWIIGGESGSTVSVSSCDPPDEFPPVRLNLPGSIAINRQRDHVIQDRSISTGSDAIERANLELAIHDTVEDRIELEVEGGAQYKAGYTVQVSTPFTWLSGSFVILEAQHDWSAKGYTTKLIVKGDILRLANLHGAERTDLNQVLRRLRETDSQTEWCRTLRPVSEGMISPLYLFEQYDNITNISTIVNGVTRYVTYNLSTLPTGSGTPRALFDQFSTGFGTTSNAISQILYIRSDMFSDTLTLNIPVLKVGNPKPLEFILVGTTANAATGTLGSPPLIPNVGTNPIAKIGPVTLSTGFQNITVQFTNLTLFINDSGFVDPNQPPPNVAGDPWVNTGGAQGAFFAIVIRQANVSGTFSDDNGNNYKFWTDELVSGGSLKNLPSQYTALSSDKGRTWTGTLGPLLGNFIAPAYIRPFTDGGIQVVDPLTGNVFPVADILIGQGNQPPPFPPAASGSFPTNLLIGSDGALRVQFTQANVNRISYRAVVRLNPF